MPIPPTFVHVAEHVPPGTDVATAVRRMEDWGIGSLVVVDDGVPVGMVTDRDLALHVLCEEKDPHECTVAECMSEKLVAVRTEDDVTDAIDRMREYGIRRLPVLDADGGLIGIVTADDLVLLLARDLNHLAAAIRRGIVQESTGVAATGSTLGKE